MQIDPKNEDLFQCQFGCVNVKKTLHENERANYICSANKYLIYYYLHSSGFPFLGLGTFLSGRYLNSFSSFLYYSHLGSLNGKERLLLPRFTALLTIWKEYVTICSAAEGNVQSSSKQSHVITHVPTTGLSAPYWFIHGSQSCAGKTTSEGWNGGSVFLTVPT